MRKVFWCCAAALVLAAAFVYGVADCCCRYPDSFLSRCVMISWSAATDFNPIARIGTTFVRATYDTLQGVSSMVTPRMTHAPAVAKLPKHAPAQPKQGVSDLNHECWDVRAMADGERLGKIVIPGDEEIRRALNPMHDLVVGGGEEAEAVPPFMAPVVDPEEGPGVMEPVKDCTDNLFEFWTGQFENATVIGDEATKTEEPARQTVPCEPIPMPVTGDYYPYYHHYHDCPQSHGCCPYSGKCPSSCDVCPGSGEEDSEPKAKSEDSPKKKRKHKKAVKPGEGCPCVPKVDTMEFRKTDARPGQFEKNPY